jgi:hypothetical protein
MAIETTPATTTAPQVPAPASAEAGQAPAQAPAQAAPATPPAAESTPEPATLLGREAFERQQKAATEPAGEAKAQEPAQATEAEYELKIPEGMVPDDTLLGQFRPLAKELGLKAEQAQKLVDLYVGRQQAQAVEAQANQRATTRAWAEDLKKDPEIGGAQFDRNIDVARQAATKFGGPKLLELFDRTGLGSHPDVVRTFLRMGRLLQPDQVAATIGAPPPQTQKKPWEILYQNSHYKQR